MKKYKDRECESFEKEKSDKLKNDYKWINGEDENLTFVKMAMIVFFVIVGLIAWFLLI